MDCQAADEALDAILDGEAHVETRREVLAHLEACVTCREEWAYRQLLRLAIRQGGDAVDTPSYLWERIGAGLDTIEYRRLGRQRRRALLAGSTLAVAVLIGLLFSSWPLRSPASPFMVESVDNYIRYLLSNAPYDLQTRDADRVRRWFQGRLDFAVEPPDLSAEGFQLLGTRMGYFLDRVEAEIGYEGHQHRLSIFMTKAEGIGQLVGERVSRHGQEFFVTSTKGYTVVAWRDGPENIVCSIVADLSREQLLRLAFAVAGVSS